MNEPSIVDLGDAMVETKQLPEGEYRDNLAEPSEKAIGV